MNASWFSAELRAFLSAARWTYAKTMPEWPHEYIVRSDCKQAQFEALVGHIREHGYQGSFYNRPITYFDEGGLVYWTMGAPLAETTIVNRCKKRDSYEERLKMGRLSDTA